MKSGKQEEPVSREFIQCITPLTQEMVESYHEDDAYTTYTSTALPNRNEIIGIVCDIRELFYPRHYGSRELFNCTIQYYIGDILMRI